jgi:hypothetical protein
VRRACWLLAAIAIAGCELQEVQITEVSDVIIAEVILETGKITQLAWLHRTREEAKDQRVTGANVSVRSSTGQTAIFQPTRDSVCMVARRDSLQEGTGSCYASNLFALDVVPGRTYQLDIRTADGRTLAGSTTVPGEFGLQRPAPPGLSDCTITPMTKFEVRWSRSEGAWVYASETSLRNIRAPLRAAGIDIDRDPIRLFGLSLSAADTTIVFPTEFGVFDRLNDELTEALAFIQEGLPAGVSARTVIAAADRNYVNWERGGSFNPSGFVRVPSVFGDGTGVFGSLVTKTFTVNVRANPGPTEVRC